MNHFSKWLDRFGSYFYYNPIVQQEKKRAFSLLLPSFHIEGLDSKG